jgi:hypothetical protein
MKEILDNWIFITHKKDISSNLIKSFWERLSMFLALNSGECPKAIFTSNRDIWKKYEGEGGRAFYDENTPTMIFWLPAYEINKKFVKDNLSEQALKQLGENLNNYIYAIPVGDIYHEMFHHVQYILGDWLYDDLLEASAEHACFLITGQDIDDYEEERIALWYIGRKMLKLKPWEFYIFLRDCIVDSQFYKEYFFGDPVFVKILANEYAGSVERLFMNMKQRLGKKKWQKMMKRDMKKIHIQIFYKW